MLALICGRTAPLLIDTELLLVLLHRPSPIALPAADSPGAKESGPGTARSHLTAALRAEAQRDFEVSEKSLCCLQFVCNFQELWLQYPRTHGLAVHLALPAMKR